MNRDEILTKARELGMMIAECEEFKKSKEAEDTYLADEAAQKMMSEYNAKCAQLSEKASKPDLTKEEYDKLQMDAQAEFIKLCTNDKINTYLEANREFSSLINQVNGIIVHFVKGDDAQGGCSGSCSSCRGCH